MGLKTIAVSLSLLFTIQIGKEMNRIERAVAKAFDDFIRATGGNIDHRAANNRVRLELTKFYERMFRLDADDFYGVQISNAMKRIIKEKLIHEPDRCPPKFAVYDHLGRKVSEGELPSYTEETAAPVPKKQDPK